MIEGSLADVSLPGLLQFLATESNKSFRIKLISGPSRGEVFISEGELLSAHFGILEGNDALIEFLFWHEGTFVVEKLASRFKHTSNTNLKIDLKQENSFADQMLFLQEESVGLNTEIVPSPGFGTPEWQAALTKQPLSKDDFIVLGWITDGRTMRQAMREFNFDVVRAAASLFRLLITGSVVTLRPSLKGVDEVESDKRDEPGADQADGMKEPLAAPVEVEQVSVVTRTEISTAGGVIPEKPAKAETVVAMPEVALVESKTSVSAQTFDSLPAVGTPAFEQVLAAAGKSSSSNSSSNSFAGQKPSPEPEPKVDIPANEGEKRNFDIRRTDPLPLVAIDIERLFQTNFHVSPFGQLALTNDALDEELRSLLADFKQGKTFIAVATQPGRHAGQVLHTCKYSLERGYLDPPDAVASLTADLLLGRVEIEQYLLQRRRMTGDELRDLVDLARQKGVKLVELLVKIGFMTQSDWERLTAEKDRFLPR